MSLGNTVRQGTQWMITKNVGAQIGQFAVGIILARLLVPDDFGLVTTIQIFTGVVGMIAGGSISMALVQAKQLGPRDYDVVFTVQLIIGALIFAGFYLIAPAFAVAFDNPGYVELLRVAALDFFWRPFYNTLNASLQRDMRFKAQASMLFFSMAVNGIVSIALAWYGFGVWSMILSPLLSKIIYIPIFIVVARQPLRLHLERATLERLSGYGVRMSANNLIVYFNRRIDNIIVSRVLGAASLGLYNKALSLHFIPIEIIGESVYQTVFRALSSEQDNLALSRYLYFRTVTLVSVYTLPFYVGLWWLGASFIEVVYGVHWMGAAAPLQILVLAGVFHCVSWPSQAVIAARNRLGSELRIQIGYGILLTAGCLISVNWGMLGIAWTVLVLMGYQAGRLYLLACRSLQAEAIHLFAALRPALLLNTVLFAVLAVVNFGLHQLDIDTHSARYLLLMTFCGMMTYGLSFFLIPIHELSSEVQRWKTTLLRLPKT